MCLYAHFYSVRPERTGFIPPGDETKELKTETRMKMASANFKSSLPNYGFRISDTRQNSHLTQFPISGENS